MARPSQQMSDILSGKLEPGEADQAVQSWLRLPVYNMALRVLRHGTKEERRAALDGIVGGGLRAIVEEECLRIFRGAKK